ncbi:MAG: hypothetical protein JWR05_982 [Mucilaginibacter sp.]|nr:hypothetical protein [Mucilaginibacter sp.]
MDQYLDNRHKQILWSLLANPADTGQLYATNLQQMVNDHPQSGLLQILFARAADKQNIKKAAVYYKAGTLYKLMHNPHSLPVVSQNKIIRAKVSESENYFSIPVALEDTRTTISHEFESTAIDEETQDEIQDIDTIIHSYEEQAAHAQTGESPVDEPAVETETIIPELNNSYQEQSTIQEEETPVTQTEEPVTLTNLSADNGYREEKEYFRQDIEDDVYEEIVGIDDIGFEPVVNVMHETEEEAIAAQQARQNNYANENDYPEDEDKGLLEKAAGITDRDVAIDEEKLILGNIVSADYLTFDKKLDELRNADNYAQPSSAPITAEAQQNTETVKENQDMLSRYNDDNMPYSFLWWLDKTRKEHAGSLQPYATEQTPKEGAAPDAFVDTNTEQPHVKPVKRVAPDELQQQYYENIFSLTSVSEIEKDDNSKGIAFDHTKKEDVIIERFIHNEPQIRPPAADRLDNENKAKKSSEDQGALVTETLARIYTEQMLYHKAIATYKKLILKFPEKKLYFAAQIEQLEKKTN